MNISNVAHEHEIKTREDIQLLDANFTEIYTQNISYIFHNVSMNTDVICNISQIFFNYLQIQVQFTKLTDKE